MLVHVLKECQCTLSYWSDRHSLDQWKDEAWAERTKTETLKVGQVIKAVKVCTSVTRQDHYLIDFLSVEGMKNCYLDVPWDSIEIVN